MNKIVFTVKDEDGKEHELCVVRPNQKVVNGGQKEYNKAFAEAVDSKAILRARVEKIMREQQIWDDQKQELFDKLQKTILDNERALGLGGIKKSEGKKLALEVIGARAGLRALLAERNDLDANTAESQAYNARFNYYVSQCVVYNNNRDPYFKSHKDYLEQGESEAAQKGATNLALLLYDLDPDHEKKQFEYQFLLEHGFVDDKLRLINKDKKLVDVKGRLVNEDGHYINEQGELTDSEGALVDQEGRFKLEQKPFLEDDE